MDHEGVQSVKGTLFDGAVLEDAMRGCRAVVHLVGIIREVPSQEQTFERIHFEGAKRVIDAAARAGVRRFVHMSAIGAREDSASDYARTKAMAEKHLRVSGLAFTIYRPSIIHGRDGAFMQMVADWANAKAMPFLFMPYFGTGLLGQSSRLLQPVYVGDVARAFADAAERDDLIGKTIDLVGPDRMTWPEMYAIVSTALRGKRRASLGIPQWYASLLTRVLPAALLPFNRSQVRMAGEDNVGDARAMERELGWRPHGFEASFATYADALRSSA